MERTTTEDFLMKWNGRSGGSIDYSMEDIKNLRLESELAYSLDWTETSLFENFRVGVRWGKVCFLMDSKFGFTSSCWRKKAGWFVLLKSANCYCSKAFVCRQREVLRKEVDLLTGGGWNRTRPKLLTTGLQWVLPILHYLRWIFPLDCPWGMILSYLCLFGTTTFIEYFFLLSHRPKPLWLRLEVDPSPAMDRDFFTQLWVRIRFVAFWAIRKNSRFLNP